MISKINKKQELSKSEKNKIAQLYQKMFNALVIIRLCRGETLGVARQKSMEQMKSYVKSKTNVAHPMNEYILSTSDLIHREIARINMTDKNSDKKIETNSEPAKKMLVESTRDFSQSLKVLNDMYKKYMPEQEAQKTSTIKSFALARRHALMQQIILHQMQRAA